MGQDWRPNKGLGIEMILEILTRSKLRHQTPDEKQEWKWKIFGAYVAITYVLSLRGVEGLLIDLAGLIKFFAGDEWDYVVITLLGKIKGEHRDRCHLLPCVKTTDSGIDMIYWVNILINEHSKRQRTHGPAISDWEGSVLSTKVLDEQLVELLEEIFDDTPKLFPTSIQNKDEIHPSYQVFRSLRRSSDTRAIEQNVSKSDIDIVNRWHTVEAAKGNRPNLPMAQHYAQVELLLKPFLRYTSAM
jgi:hypothetical protein